MTMYVLAGLQAAQRAGFDVRPRVLEEGHVYLLRLIDGESQPRLPWDDTEHLQTHAYLAYVLSLGSLEKGRYNRDFQEQANGWKRNQRDQLFERRKRLNPYGLALLALTLHHAKDAGRAETVLQDLLKLVERDDANATAWVPTPADSWWRWYNSDIETNAWALRALVHIDPKNDLAPGLAKRLIERRLHGHHWRSTRDSALAVAALADYVTARNATIADCRAVLRVDGRVAREVTLTKDNFLITDPRLIVEGLRLAPGRHEITVAKAGRGELYFEDRKPAGCEPVQLQSGGLWFGHHWANVELRDDTTVFFLPWLERGDHVLRYRLRAEVPGVFYALPATGFAMYAPEVHAASAAQRVRIAD